MWNDIIQICQAPGCVNELTLKDKQADRVLCKSCFEKQRIADNRERLGDSIHQSGKGRWV